MKINWGTGIVIAFIGFISFILYMVITMHVDERYSHDLVEDNYYSQELQVQNDIEKQKNANALSKKISWTKTTEGIIITFPETQDPKSITGKVRLYRPSNRKFDFENPILLTNHKLLIPHTRLLAGRWNIIVDWLHHGKPYLYKKEITY